jgi:hypothetical protein
MGRARDLLNRLRDRKDAAPEEHQPKVSEVWRAQHPEGKSWPDSQELMQHYFIVTSGPHESDALRCFRINSESPRGAPAHVLTGEQLKLANLACGVIRWQDNPVLVPKRLLRERKGQLLTQDVVGIEQSFAVAAKGSGRGR